MNEIISKINDPKFHAVHFRYKNMQYSFSGWWLLEWDNGMKDYNSIQEFLNDQNFDNNKLADVLPFITDVWFEFEP